MFVYIYIYIYMYICRYMYIRVCVYIYIYMYYHYPQYSTPRLVSGVCHRADVAASSTAEGLARAIYIYIYI